MLPYLRYSVKALITIYQSKQYLSFHIPPADVCQNAAQNYLQGNRRKQYLFSLFLYGSAWAILRNKPLTITEKRRLALLSIAAPLFDDLYDTYHLYPELIESLVLEPAGTETEPDDALLYCFKSILLRLYESLSPSQVSFRHFVLQLMRAQEKSRNLFGFASASDLETHTREKGGLAAVLIRTMLDNPITQEEIQVALSLGFLAQLMDDLFDLTSDCIEGKTTSACLFQSAEEAREFFLETEKHCFTQCAELPFPAERIQQFAYYMHLLLSPVFVCLDYYVNYTKRTGINLFNRALQTPVLVCDMEKWSNRFRLLLLASRNTRSVFSFRTLA